MLKIKIKQLNLNILDYKIYNSGFKSYLIILKKYSMKTNKKKLCYLSLISHIKGWIFNV